MFSLSSITSKIIPSMKLISTRTISSKSNVKNFTQQYCIHKSKEVIDLIEEYENEKSLLKIDLITDYYKIETKNTVQNVLNYAQQFDIKHKFRYHLEKKQHEYNLNYDWGHITQQNGVDCMIGLTSFHMALLKENHAIYITDDGTINLNKLNTNNIEYVADSILKTIKDVYSYNLLS